MKFHPRIYGNYNGIGKLCVFAAFVLIGGLMTWRYGASIYWRNNSMKLDEEALLKSERQELKLADVNVTHHQNVVFLHTHDTNGHVFQQVILRHAIVNDGGALVAVPSTTDGDYLGPYPDHFRSVDLQPLKPEAGRSYGVLTHHIRWDSAAMRKAMPNDTIYVTILRDPAKHFLSLYKTHQMNSFYNVTWEQFSRSSNNATWRESRKDGKFGINQMAFDLGADVKVIENDAAAILEFAGQLDGQFHLVALSELMEESLILLADLMRWNVDDVVNFNLPSTDGATSLEPDVVTGLEMQNRVDKIIYDYFNVRFMERIEVYGAERMTRERSRLAERKRFWSDACSNGTNTSIAEAERAMCVDLSRSGHQLTDVLREKQAQFVV